MTSTPPITPDTEGLKEMLKICPRKDCFNSLIDNMKLCAHHAFDKAYRFEIYQDLGNLLAKHIPEYEDLNQYDMHLREIYQIFMGFKEYINR